MCFLSVIIPVYNVEEYIEQCILSVVNQTFKNFELILVNDGSQDNSIKLAENILKDYENTYLFHQVNQGQSVARNFGLSKAQGEYIIFIDSDDFLFEEDAFEVVAKNIIKNNFPDLIIHEETRFYNNGVEHNENNVEKTKEIRTGNFTDDLRLLIYNELFVASPWDKVIKREVLVKNGIIFPEGLQSEDMIWSSDLIPFISSYSCLDYSFYAYRKNVSDSITKSIDEKHLMDIIFMLDQIIKNNIPSQNNIYEAFWAEYFVFLLMNSDCIKINKKKFWKFLEENKFLIKKGYSKNVDKVYKFYKIFGLRLTSKLLIMFRMINNFNRKYQFIHE
ncbi:MAG: glycosyltransferase family 2 protein [Empedobacter falsenii]